MGISKREIGVFPFFIVAILLFCLMAYSAPETTSPVRDTPRFPSPYAVAANHFSQKETTPPILRGEGSGQALLPILSRIKPNISVKLSRSFSAIEGNVPSQSFSSQTALQEHRFHLFSHKKGTKRFLLLRSLLI